MNSVFRLIDLIEDIKKVDQIITLHKDADTEESNMMLSQYEAKKVKLTAHLLNELTAPRFSSTSSLLFIKHFLEKYYADTPGHHTDKQVNEIRQLEALL